MGFVYCKVSGCTKGRSFPLSSVRALVMSAFLVTIFFGGFVQNSFGAQANLSWSASPSADVAGYKILYGTSSADYSQSMDVGNATSYTITGLDDGKEYYFAAVAYDTSGVQSEFSNEATYTTPAAPPPLPIYTLSASAGAGGSISPSGSIALSQGLDQLFTITPGTGYRIANVTVDGVSVGAVSSYVFSNITANHGISVVFSQNTLYSITSSAGTGGSISPTGNKTVLSGGTQSYTIKPLSQYKISDVLVDGVSVGAVSSFTFRAVTANHNIKAIFSRKSSNW